ncbi:hypothetical protein G6F68_013277 [Rhizopus microsporus]|nr:hypothetical protein G6F68_013277 [Rhizopus microsporus]
MRGRRQRLRRGARCARAQPQECRCLHSAQCTGGVLRGLGFGQVVAGLRHRVRRSAAALLRVGGAVCTAPDRPGGRARCGCHRRPAAGSGPAAAARGQQCALIGGQRDHAVQPGAHDVLPRRGLPGPSAHAVRGGLLAEHAAGRLQHLPRPGACLRSDRSADGAGPVADHP